MINVRLNVQLYMVAKVKISVNLRSRVSSQDLKMSWLPLTLPVVVLISRMFLWS